jgi:hypothetical protein
MSLVLSPQSRGVRRCWLRFHCYRHVLRRGCGLGRRQVWKQWLRLQVQCIVPANSDSGISNISSSNSIIIISSSNSIIIISSSNSIIIISSSNSIIIISSSSPATILDCLSSSVWFISRTCVYRHGCCVLLGWRIKVHDFNSVFTTTSSIFTLSPSAIVSASITPMMLFGPSRSM